MIRAVVADDEVLARQKLRQLLKDVDDVEIVGECATAAETIELVRLTSPELLFLDIRMSDMDGFDVLEKLSSDVDRTLPQVIFVTANDGYAVRAFDIHAIDYLLKPFTPERLQSAVQRVRERLTCGEQGQKDLGKKTEQDRYTTRMVFKSRGRILFLSVDDIRWIEAQENYVKICTGKDSHLLRETIGNLENRLDPHSFLRVHRSAIVNLHHVKEVRNEADGDATVVLKSGEQVPMSRSYRSKIHKLLKFQ
ncbi:MAG TPA: LytTR family DNA-binding domain-containing protein [Terracidiphilus sp.]|nr:LytTR family DNA-binding domain-containing protein [Terracidiphilus sp.]